MEYVDHDGLGFLTWAMVTTVLHGIQFFEMFWKNMTQDISVKSGWNLRSFKELSDRQSDRQKDDGQSLIKESDNSSPEHFMFR